MPWTLESIRESSWLLPGNQGAIYPLGDTDHPPDPEKKPLILVHGIFSHPDELQPLVDRLRRQASDYQLYFFAYDGNQRLTRTNGHDLAVALRAFRDREVTLVAHSMGGLVARLAINELASHPLAFPRIQVYSIDTPWHGFMGPSDSGPRPSWINRMLLGIMPQGLADMRAGSWMFQDPRHGVNTSPLPRNFSLHIAFSRSGHVALNYHKGKLRSIAWQAMLWIHRGLEPTGSFMLQNFWAALRHSAEFPSFEARLRELKRAGYLDLEHALNTLENFFPEYPGDHTSVLIEHPGELSYLDALIKQLEN